MADAFGVVKVGKSEWGFLKFTPLSRIAAIVGAVASDTKSARRPSGMKSTTLCGWSAAPAGRGIAMAPSANAPERTMLLGFRTDRISLMDCARRQSAVRR